MPDNRVKTFLSVLALLFACWVSAAELPPLTHNLAPLATPLEAPALRLLDMDEEVVDLQKLKGRTVVVNFWATWCPPCRREMGSLEKLHLAMQEKNVVVLAVNIGEDIDTVFPFIGTVEPSPSFRILFDTNAESLGAWKVKGLPTTYIVNPEGQVVYRAIGGREFDHPELLGKIEALGN